MFFWKSKPSWVYLGWIEISFVDENKQKLSSTTVHFYARGDKLKERKFECADYSYWSRHAFVQQMIIPWVYGNNLWEPIAKPSENLKEWTKKDCGYEWKSNHWYKPVEHVEANVIKFPDKNAG